MRSISLWLGVPAACAMMAVSKGCNWYFLSGFGTTPAAVVLLSMASIAIDVFKAVAPFWLCEACKARKFGRGLLSILVLVCCFAVSMGSALGFLAEMHAALVGGREAANERHRAVKESRADLQAQLQRVAGARAATVVEAAIAALRHDGRWVSSHGCTKDTGQEARDFCREQGALETELREAREAMKLRAEIAKRQETIARLETEGGGRDADPRGSLIARFTGLRSLDVTSSLELCVAVLIELCAAFGLLLAVEGSRDRDGQPPQGRMASGPQLELLPRKRNALTKADRKALPSPRRIRFSGGGGGSVH
jgi:hypothetical protein